MGGLFLFLVLLGTLSASAVEAPTALPACPTNASSFTARWTAADGAAGYCIDVATSNAFRPGVGGDLIISEMCDPESNYRTNRYIEIYNAGTKSVDLAGWSVQAILARGASTNYFTWNLTGSIASAQALVCGDANAAGFTPAFAGNWAASNYYWTGADSNDGARILNAFSEVVDIACLKGADRTTYRLASNAAAETSFRAEQWGTMFVDEASESTPGWHACDHPGQNSGDFVRGCEGRDVGNVTQFGVTGLTSSTFYYFRVRAYDSTETSADSNTQTIETLEKPEPTGHVTGLRIAAATHRTIVLAWTDALGGDPPDGYLVRGSTNGYADIPDPSDGVSVANDTAWTAGRYARKVPQGAAYDELRGLVAGQSYRFKVFPYANAFGAIDYKTNGTVPCVTCVTTAAPLEDMEGVVVGSYTNGAVGLRSGKWFFDDALLGITVCDRKADQRAARIRGNGSVTMEFDVNGVETLSVEHANYHTDAGGGFQAHKSTDGGANWTPLGGQVSCGASLSTAEFAVHEAGAVRFKIEQTGGNRINLDNIRVSGFVSGGTVLMIR